MMKKQYWLIVELNLVFYNRFTNHSNTIYYIYRRWLAIVLIVILQFKVPRLQIKYLVSCAAERIGNDTVS